MKPNNFTEKERKFFDDILEVLATLPKPPPLTRMQRIAWWFGRLAMNIRMTVDIWRGK